MIRNVMRALISAAKRQRSQSTKYHIEVLESETCPDCQGAKLQGWYRCKACVATRINAGALR